jgi:REP element-mobilizing transposase RayT
MARPLRLHLPGKVYHLFVRGDNKLPIFRRSLDYRHLLEILARALDRFTMECITYSLLPNHFHLLVVPDRHTVSRLMHQVNGTYARWFNKKHGRVGHVTQGRFGGRIIDDNEYLLTALRYIAMNPVAAGLVKQPENWPWSSYRAIAGLCEAPPFLTMDRIWRGLGCTDAEVGRQRYIAHVKQGDTPEELHNALLFGGDLLKRQARPLLEAHREEREFLYRDRFAARPPLDSLFIDLGRQSLAAAARTAFHVHGYTLTEIGELIGRSPSTICKWIHRIEAEQEENSRRIGRSWHGNVQNEKFKV